ncbi:MAG: hypothetical protein HY676_00775 [Chloroflexi bacterium]|nr:hypothetical protein [Chloroflexota bacterium]
MRKKGPTLVRIALAIMLILMLLTLTAAPAAATVDAGQVDGITLGTFNTTTHAVTSVDFYRYGATATIILKTAADSDTTRVNTATVVVKSTTDAVGVNVTLTETDINTAIYIGTVVLYGVTTPATAPPTGQVLVTSGDTVTVTAAISAVKLVTGAASGNPAAALTDTALIDNTAPTVAITTPAAFTPVGTAPNKVDTAYMKYATGTNYIDLGGTLTDAVSGVSRVDVSLDGGTTYYTATGAATWTYRWFGPADGTYVLKVKGVDTAGNEKILSFVNTLPAGCPTTATCDSSSMVIKVDNTKPTVSDAASTPANVHKGLKTKITVKVSDATAGVNTVKVDLSPLNAAYPTAQDMYDDGPLATGETCATNVPAGARCHGDSTANDGIYSINDLNADGTSDIVVPTTLGAYNLTITVTDKSGNSQTATAVVTVVNDVTAPTPVSFSATGVVSGGNARPGTSTVAGDEVMFAVKATDDLSGVGTVVVETKELTSTPTVAAPLTLSKVSSTTTGSCALLIGQADTWCKTLTLGGPGNPLPTVGTKTLTVTVTDNAVLSATKTATLTVATTVSTYRLNVVAGWNLVSVPSAPLDTNLANMLGAAVSRVTTYSGTEGRWRDTICTVSRGACSWAGSLDTIVAGQGYFMNATAAASIVINLEPVEVLSVPPSYNLTAGWNLISYTNLGLAQTQTLALTYLRGLSVIALYRLDTVAGVPVRMIVDTAINGGENVALGQGYWLYIDRAGKLVP